MTGRGAAIRQSEALPSTRLAPPSLRSSVSTAGGAREMAGWEGSQVRGLVVEGWGRGRGKGAQVCLVNRAVSARGREPRICEQTTKTASRIPAQMSVARLPLRICHCDADLAMQAQHPHCPMIHTCYEMSIGVSDSGWPRYGTIRWASLRLSPWQMRPGRRTRNIIDILAIWLDVFALAGACLERFERRTFWPWLWSALSLKCLGAFNSPPAGLRSRASIGFTACAFDFPAGPLARFLECSDGLTFWFRPGKEDFGMTRSLLGVLEETGKCGFDCVYGARKGPLVA